LEITTDESITPTEALQEAFSIYNNITERFVELVAGDMTGHTEEEVEVEDEEAADTESESAVNVNDIEMSTRLKNALTNSAITDLRVLDGKTEDELLEIRGMGQKSVEELIEIMKDNNLTILQ
jgi:DNA-directed RNA polymerase subunit alpha